VKPPFAIAGKPRFHGERGGGDGGGLDEITAAVVVVFAHGSILPAMRRLKLYAPPPPSSLSFSCFTRAPPAPISLAVEKFTLKNGMTVILYPEPRPSYRLRQHLVRVGSKDEIPHRSGFAHLFEHLMFMGTERVPNGDFDRLMEAVGGSNNASTSADRTNYYSSGPASSCPLSCGSTPTGSRTSRGPWTRRSWTCSGNVVLNELRQSYEKPALRPRRARDPVPALSRLAPVPLRHDRHRGTISRRRR